MGHRLQRRGRHQVLRAGVLFDGGGEGPGNKFRVLLPAQVKRAYVGEDVGRVLIRLGQVVFAQQPADMGTAGGALGSIGQHHHVSDGQRRLLQDETLVGSAVSGGAGKVYTDFAIHADGVSRMLLLATAQLTPRRLGRLVQRLLEIETYRMAALLGLPAARQAAQVLASAERELAELALAIREADQDNEAELLDRLTRLAGQVESEYAGTHSRFSASSAYFELVDKRIQDIQEIRLNGLQTIGEFMDRRLSPAKATCEWATRRQNALSERVSRVSSLLRTRVEIAQQQSSQQLLGTMTKRQGLQLQLQSTVEGLSVAAITYYIAGLISYLAKGAQKLGWPLSPESTAALAIPLIALAIWWSLRRMHQRLFHGKNSH